MKLDNLNNFSAEKLQQIIEQRWGQRVELSSLSEDSLDLFKTSVQESIRSFESSMSFNQNSYNSGGSGGVGGEGGGSNNH